VLKIGGKREQRKSLHLAPCLTVRYANILCKVHVHLVTLELSPGVESSKIDCHVHATDAIRLGASTIAARAKELTRSPASQLSRFRTEWDVSRCDWRLIGEGVNLGRWYCQSCSSCGVEKVVGG
jgi:hypothetical protein